MTQGWRIIAAPILLPQQGGWCPLLWVPAVPGRPQAGGRFTQASPRSARCRPYSNSGRM